MTKKIVVVGFTRRMGTRLVTMFTHDSHEIVAASRRSRVDVVTGVGLSEALNRGAVVVDAVAGSEFVDDRIRRRG